MNETLCPMNHKPCVKNKCMLWEQYSNKHHNGTGEEGECLQKLALDSILNHYSPDVSSHYAVNASEDDDKLDVPY